MSALLATARFASSREWGWAVLTGALFGFALAVKGTAALFAPLVPLLVAVDWHDWKPSGVRSFVAEGRWEPAGGMWVETDLNLPAGESLARQFLHGQRAFEAWFGEPCPGAFLPDDFGYPGSVPQLARLAGCGWFFTQKLSWNDTNHIPRVRGRR